MEIQEETNDFLEYTGKVELDDDYKKYNFKFANNTLSSEDYVLICNPTLDNTFKTIFSKNTIILKSFLNDILFPNISRIRNVEYIRTEYPGKFRKNGIGSIRIDVGCKCELEKMAIKDKNNGCIFNNEDEDYKYEDYKDKDNKDEDYKKEDYKDEEDDLDYNNDIRMDIDIDEKNKKDKETVYQKMEEKNKKKNTEDLIIDLEMQKGFNQKNTRRFLRYISHLDVTIDSDKIWVVALLIDEAKNPRLNKSNHINYVQPNIRDYSHIKDYDTHVVLEIDLNYCSKILERKNKEKIILTNQELGLKGKEWIKLLTIALWCDKKGDELYIFPTLDKMHFHQDNVKNALIMLSHQDPMYQIYVREEKDLKEELKEFMNLKENEKYHKIEIAKRDEKIKKQKMEMQKKVEEMQKKDEEMLKKDELIKKLNEQINFLKNDTNPKSNGKK